MKCPVISELPLPPIGSSGWPWTAESHHWWQDNSSTDWPPISIITPSYNTASYLEAAIRSVLLQGYPNLELIVIDGGSNDNSYEIISKYSPWISYWCSEPDKGQYHAINKGFKISKNSIMGWLNSDDMLVPDGLSIVGSIFKQHKEKADWITGLPFYWNNAGNRAALVDTIPHSDMLLRYGSHDGRAIQWIMQEGTFWRRSLWERAGAYLSDDLKYAGDFELWMRFARFARLYLVNATIGGNRRRAEQKTSYLKGYNDEIDIILRSACGSSWPLFLRLQPIRSIIRFYLKYISHTNQIRYDVKTQSWNLK